MVIRRRRKGERLADEEPTDPAGSEEPSSWQCSACLSIGVVTVNVDTVARCRCGYWRPGAPDEEPVLSDIQTHWPGHWGRARSWGHDDRLWAYDPHLLESRGPSW